MINVNFQIIFIVVTVFQTVVAFLLYCVADDEARMQCRCAHDSSVVDLERPLPENDGNKPVVLTYENVGYRNDGEVHDDVDGSEFDDEWDGEENSAVADYDTYRLGETKL